MVSLLFAYPAVVVPTPVTTPGTMRMSVAAFRPLSGNSWRYCSLHHLRERARLRVDHLRVGGDRHGFSDGSHHESHIQRGRRVDIQANAGLLESVEAVRGHLDTV